MKKAKANPFASIAAPAAPAPAAHLAAVKRGPGRPKLRSAPVQTTTIRLDADDHLALRMLALRDRMTMNDLIAAALRDYCEQRGVKLKG